MKVTRGFGLALCFSLLATVGAAGNLVQETGSFGGTAISPTEIQWSTEGVFGGVRYELHTADHDIIGEPVFPADPQNPPAEITFNETGLEPNTEYCRHVLVEIVTSPGIEVESEEVCVTTLGGVQAPTNFSGTALSSNSVQWSWDAGSGLTGTQQLEDELGNIITSGIPLGDTLLIEASLVPGSIVTRRIVAFSNATRLESNLTTVTLPTPPGPQCSGSASQRFTSARAAFQLTVDSLRTQGVIDKKDSRTLLKGADRVGRAVRKFQSAIGNQKRLDKNAGGMVQEGVEFVELATAISEEAGLGSDSIVVSGADEIFQASGAIWYLQELPDVREFEQENRIIQTDIPGFGPATILIDGVFSSDYSRIPETDSASITPISTDYSFAIIANGETEPSFVGTISLDGAAGSDGTLCLADGRMNLDLNLVVNLTVPTASTCQIATQVTNNFMLITTPVVCPCLGVEEISAEGCSQELPSGVAGALTAAMFAGACSIVDEFKSHEILTVTGVGGRPKEDITETVQIEGVASVSNRKPGSTTVVNNVTATVSWQTRGFIGGPIITGGTVAAGPGGFSITYPFNPLGSQSVRYHLEFAGSNDHHAGTIGPGHNVTYTVVITAHFSDGTTIPKTTSWTAVK